MAQVDPALVQLLDTYVNRLVQHVGSSWSDIAARAAEGSTNYTPQICEAFADTIFNTWNTTMAFPKEIPMNSLLSRYIASQMEEACKSEESNSQPPNDTNNEGERVSQLLSSNVYTLPPRDSVSGE